VTDEFTVPGCRTITANFIGRVNEAAWWQKLNIDPLPVASGSGSIVRTIANTPGRNCKVK